MEEVWILQTFLSHNYFHAWSENHGIHFETVHFYLAWVAREEGNHAFHTFFTANFSILHKNSRYRKDMKSGENMTRFSNRHSPLNCVFSNVFGQQQQKFLIDGPLFPALRHLLYIYAEVLSTQLSTKILTCKRKRSPLSPSVISQTLCSVLCLQLETKLEAIMRMVCFFLTVSRWDLAITKAKRSLALTSLHILLLLFLIFHCWVFQLFHHFYLRDLLSYQKLP